MRLEVLGRGNFYIGGVEFSNIHSSQSMICNLGSCLFQEYWILMWIWISSFTIKSHDQSSVKLEKWRISLVLERSNIVKE